MKTLRITLFLLFVFANNFVSAQNKQDQDVLNAELKRFEAMTRRDTVALATMLDETLVYMHSNGLIENKKAHLSAISSGKLRYDVMERKEAALRRYKKTALVNGLLHASGLLQDKPFDINIRYTAVYRKSKAKWLLLNWQSTRI